MTAPLRAVVAARMEHVRGSVLAGDSSRRLRQWLLTLDCGHHAEARVRFPPLADAWRRPNGWHPRPATEALPAPRRARCDACANNVPVKEQPTVIESRLYEVVYTGQSQTRHGALQRVVGIRCPWCDTVTEAYVWSLAGSGKRCECGAKFTWHGQTAEKAR